MPSSIFEQDTEKEKLYSWKSSTLTWDKKLEFFITPSLAPEQSHSLANLHSSPLQAR